MSFASTAKSVEVLYWKGISGMHVVHKFQAANEKSVKYVDNKPVVQQG